MTLELIYPAVLVFLLMLTGVVLTVLEFNDQQKKQKEGKGKAD